MSSWPQEMRGRAVIPSFLPFTPSLTEPGFLSGQCSHRSPHTSKIPTYKAPPGRAIQNPSAKNKLSIQGITETLSNGAQGVPFKFIPHKPRATSTALLQRSALSHGTSCYSNCRWIFRPCFTALGLFSSPAAPGQGVPLPKHEPCSSKEPL